MLILQKYIRIYSCYTFYCNTFMARMGLIFGGQLWRGRKGGGVHRACLPGSAAPLGVGGQALWRGVGKFYNS